MYNVHACSNRKLNRVWFSLCCWCTEAPLCGFAWICDWRNIRSEEYLILHKQNKTQICLLFHPGFFFFLSCSNITVMCHVCYTHIYNTHNMDLVHYRYNGGDEIFILSRTHIHARKQKSINCCSKWSHGNESKIIWLSFFIPYTYENWWWHKQLFVHFTHRSSAISAYVKCSRNESLSAAIVWIVALYYSEHSNEKKKKKTFFSSGLL